MEIMRSNIMSKLWLTNVSRKFHQGNKAFQCKRVFEPKFESKRNLLSRHLNVQHIGLTMYVSTSTFGAYCIVKQLKAENEVEEIESRSLFREPVLPDSSSHSIDSISYNDTMELDSNIWQTPIEGTLEALEASLEAFFDIQSCGCIESISDNDTMESDSSFSQGLMKSTFNFLENVVIFINYKFPMKIYEICFPIFGPSIRLNEPLLDKNSSNQRKVDRLLKQLKDNNKDIFRRKIVFILGFSLS